MLVSKQDIVRTALTFVGTPVIHHGRIKGVGVDCIGLIACVGQELGLNVMDRKEWRKYRAAPTRKDGALVPRYLKVQGFKQRHGEFSRGDVLMFAHEKRGTPRHLAIAVDEHHICHACPKTRRVVITPLYAKLRSQIMDTYEYPGVA